MTRNLSANPTMAAHDKREARRNWVMHLTYAAGIVLALTVITLVLSIPGPSYGLPVDGPSKRAEAKHFAAYHVVSAEELQRYVQVSVRVGGEVDEVWVCAGDDGSLIWGRHLAVYADPKGTNCSPAIFDDSQWARVYAYMVLGAWGDGLWNGAEGPDRGLRVEAVMHEPRPHDVTLVRYEDEDVG